MWYFYVLLSAAEVLALCMNSSLYCGGDIGKVLLYFYGDWWKCGEVSSFDFPERCVECRDE